MMSSENLEPLHIRYIYPGMEPGGICLANIKLNAYVTSVCMIYDIKK